MRSAALCSLAGLGAAFLKAASPDDGAIYLAIAEQAKAQRENEAKDFAFEIGEAVRKVLGG